MSAKEFRRGLQAGASVAIGYLPAGAAFGILARAEGLAIADVLGFSAIVFAGASQFMAVGLIAAGVPSLQIVLATLLLNFRHFLMGASLSTRLADGPRLRRALLAHWVTDETFAVASASQGAISHAYFAGLGLISWSSWISGSAAGYLVGTYIPRTVQEAMAVALYALFGALIVPYLRQGPVFVALAASAAVLHTLLRSVIGMPGGWAFVVAMVTPAAVWALAGGRRVGARE
jgi:4-azaleucine resistance transporter AzlC